MSNFDDIFEPAPQAEEFDKEAWAAKKKAERDEVYALADATAEEICTDGGKFRDYLDVQANFRHYGSNSWSYDIFCLLVANKNRVLTYDQIYEKVWGDFSSGGERETIGFHVRNLRKKLFDTDQEPAYQIESIRDVGYRFQYN